MAGLASRGARVYIGARSEQKAAAAIQEIQQIQQADPTAPACDIRFLEMDLARLASVVAAAKKLTAEEPALHGLYVQRQPASGELIYFSSIRPSAAHTRLFC